MELVAIYNVWIDAFEHLGPSIDYINDHVDGIIITYQETSNRGEGIFPLERKTYLNKLEYLERLGCILQSCEPIPEATAQSNEIRKRRRGIELAREMEYTHFFHIDSDEYWPEFKEAKQAYIDSKANGSVCRLHTYFKKPTLRLEEPEGYHVPFIHTLKRTTEITKGRYPFYVDPTRKINESNVVLLPQFMHHMSWVRLNLRRKFRNSTAEFEDDNPYLRDYERDLKHGDFLESYNRKIIEVRT